MKRGVLGLALNPATATAAATEAAAEAAVEARASAFTGGERRQGEGPAGPTRRRCCRRVERRRDATHHAVHGSLLRLYFERRMASGECQAVSGERKD
jgi:hypothetical protein